MCPCLVKMETMLQAPLITGNLYCGPVVVSAITGRTTGWVAELIREQRCERRSRRSGPVEGTTTIDLTCALTHLGCKVGRHQYVRDRPTLTQWLRRSSVRWRNDAVIIGLRSHWIVVSDDEWTDSHTRSINHVDNMQQPRRRVHGYIGVNG